MKELDRYISYIDYFQIDNVARKYIFSKTKEETSEEGKGE